VPTLLKDRSNAEEAFIVVAIPLLFGAVTGWVLGLSEPIYLLLSLIGILGGLVAGLEHEYGLEGFYRGLMGGLLFGLGILLANGIIDKEPKADLPDPEVLVIAITGAFGAGLGALGGRMRDRRTKKERATRSEAGARHARDEAVSEDREKAAV
jgi:hypothetical protein